MPDLRERTFKITSDQESCGKKEIKWNAQETPEKKTESEFSDSKREEHGQTILEF